MDSEDVGFFILVAIGVSGFFIFCVFIGWWNSDVKCEVAFNDGSSVVVNGRCYVPLHYNAVECPGITYNSFKSLKCYHTD